MHCIPLGSVLLVLCEAASTDEKVSCDFFKTWAEMSEQRGCYSQQIFNIDEIGLFIEENDH